MMGTVIFMERLSDSLSKPVASLTARPMTTGSTMRWRSVDQHERVADHLRSGDGPSGTRGRRTRAAWRHGSADGKAS
jgi:hypothetical protein